MRIQILVVSFLAAISVAAQADNAAYGNAAGQAKQACGTNALLGADADIQSRIDNCKTRNADATAATTADVTWSLVARTYDSTKGRSYEVWLDAKSGLLWGDRLDDTMLFVAAMEFDKSDITGSGKLISDACDTPAGVLANLGITQVKFGIPSFAEFVSGGENGMRQVLPNAENTWYWTKTLMRNGDYSVLSPTYWLNAAGPWSKIYNSDSVGSAYEISNTSGEHSVRCVGR